jgi:peptide/nickel transport system permease protein
VSAPPGAKERARNVTTYLIRRVATSLIVVLGVSIFVFLLLHIIYPSPAQDILGPKATQAAVNSWNKQHGFDSPWFVQYLRYMRKLVHGNLGWSYKVNQSVAALFQERWARSAYLSGMSLVLAVVIAVPLGIYQAAKRNTVGDNVATSLAFVTYAMPVYFLALILIQVFALSFPIFNYEASQSLSLWHVMLDWHSMTLPIATLTLLSVAGFSRYMRSTSIDTLAQDYIKAARAKGLPERLVLWRHLLRNASLPMVTLIGLSIPSLLAGNLITEQVFNFQGLGLLFYTSLSNVDYNVLLAYTLIGAFLTVVGNLVADFALTVADPRIRLA